MVVCCLEAWRLCPAYGCHASASLALSGIGSYTAVPHRLWGHWSNLAAPVDASQARNIAGWMSHSMPQYMLE